VSGYGMDPKPSAILTPAVAEEAAFPVLDPVCRVVLVCLRGLVRQLCYHGGYTTYHRGHGPLLLSWQAQRWSYGQALLSCVGGLLLSYRPAHLKISHGQRLLRF
jgi:hypothetical protein